MEHERFIKKMAAKTPASLRNSVTSMSGKKKDEVKSNRRASIQGGAPSLFEPSVVAVRFEYVTIKGRRKKCHRVFVLAADSGEYVKVGWVLNDDMDCCMVCHNLFYDGIISSSGKHHCRACGNLVCSACSNNQAVVAEVIVLGEVRVCNQCFFGQEVVYAHANDHLGTMVGGMGEDAGLDEILIEEEDEEYSAGLNLWSYGPVKLVKIRPAFVLKTRRANKSRVYVNICTSESVPYNSDVMVEGKRVIFICASGMGKTKNGGYPVYDACVNPKELYGDGDAFGDYERKTNVSAHVLICLSTCTSEGDFVSFQWEDEQGEEQDNGGWQEFGKEENISKKYKERVIEEGNEGGDSNKSASSFTPKMAIPCAAAFADLWQMSTRLEDVQAPAKQLTTPKSPMSSGSSPSDAHRSLLTRRITQRLATSNNATEAGSVGSGEWGSKEGGLSLAPYPGFVIKARIVGDVLKKVFINVTHHEDVKVEPGGEVVVYVGEGGDVSDREGVLSRLYYVVVSSTFFMEAYVGGRGGKRITDPPCVKKIIAAVNAVHHEELDLDHFVLPRVKGGFKGNWKEGDMVFYPPPVTASASSIPAAGTSTAVATTHSGVRPSTALDATTHATPSANSAQSTTKPAEAAPAQASAPVLTRQTLSAKASSTPPVTATAVVAVEATSFRADDTDSVFSDVTSRTDVSSFSVSRKSVTDLFYPRRHLVVPNSLPPPSRNSLGGRGSVSGESVNGGIAPHQLPGASLLTPDMLVLHRAKNVDLKTALDVKNESMMKPEVLGGWQISIFTPPNKTELFVVTAIRKNHMRKAEYRVTNARGDQWVRLKRGEKKSGLSFTLHRKVLIL